MLSGKLDKEGKPNGSAPEELDFNSQDTVGENVDEIVVVQVKDKKFFISNIEALEVISQLSAQLYMKLLSRGK